MAAKNEERSASDYSEFDQIFKETNVDYENGNALVVSSEFAPFLQKRYTFLKSKISKKVLRSDIESLLTLGQIPGTRDLK